MISVDQGRITLTGQGLSCRFDHATGRLLAIESDDVALSCGGLFVDVGVDGDFALRRFEYQSFDPFHTWELPQVIPIKEAMPEWKFEGYVQSEDSLVMTYSAAGLRMMLTYSIAQRALTMNVKVVNDRSERRLLNGIAFHLIVDGLPDDAVTFFPGNVPYKPFAVSELTPYVPVQTGLSNPLVTTCSGDTRDRKSVV